MKITKNMDTCTDKDIDMDMDTHMATDMFCFVLLCFVSLLFFRKFPFVFVFV